jgi:hypothetical protein
MSDTELALQDKDEYIGCHDGDQTNAFHHPRTPEGARGFSPVKRPP